MLAAKYHSSGWQKDLEHVLKVYYRYNLQAPFMESEWVWVRELFFDHFMAKKAEVLRLKEESPLDYMPFIAEEFYWATGMCLQELPEFTQWIKKWSYFHGLLVHRGQVEECPHLIGEELPKWPQPKPSKSHQDSYTQAEGPVAGSSESTTRPTAAPTQETPTEEPPVAEAPIPGPSHSSPPAQMETGGAGDGLSLADQAEASVEVEFQQARPPKCPHSQLRRWEAGPVLPFPLQDAEGRLASVMRFYEHAGEQTPPPDGVARVTIRHLYSHMLPRDARHLGNQVVCMIAEYHLTSSARVSSTLAPVLPEAAKPLLPALKTYVPNISFEGTRDVRVLDRAKALRVAVWLHQLDMSIRGDEMASEMLDSYRHCLGCLLGSFLVPTSHGISFREVVACCLYENRCDAQHRLNDLITRHNRVCEEIDGLVEAHRAATRSAQKRVKKDLDLRHRDLESLKACISHEESYLREDSPERDVQGDPIHQDAEAEMTPNAGANEAPSEAATAPVSGSPTSGDPAMQVNKGAVGPPPTSPVSRDDDDLLSSNDMAGVEVDLAHLTISSPSGQDGEGEEASHMEVPPPLEDV